MEEGHVLVVRVGDGSFNASLGNAHAIYLDEYSISGILVKTYPVPVADSGPNKKCVLWGGYQYNDGLAQLSADGRSVVFPCYYSTAGATNPVTAPLARVYGMISMNGVIDTSTTTIDIRDDIFQ